MAEKKHNLVEEALLQMKNLEEAVTENAKGILASTMKEEISELVKESLSEEEIEIEDEEMSAEAMEGENKEKESEMTEQEDDMEPEMDMEDMEVEDEDEMESDEMDMEMDMDDDEMEMDSDEMLMMDLPGDDMEVDDEDEVLLPLDLTDASDEEILKVFKAMGDEDGIIVTKDDDEITLKDDETDAEYKIQMESEEDDEIIADEEKMEGEYEEGYEMEEEGEVVYEIELGEEDEEEYDHYRDAEKDDADHIEKLEKDMEDDAEKTEAKEGKWGGNKHDYKRRDGHKLGDVEGHYKDYEMEEGKEMEGEYKESSVRSNVNGRATNKKPQGFPKSLKRPAQRNESLEREVAQLREKNEEYRKALNIFKEKLNEVAVFNSNLAYATRLFTEHSTTKQEKINILRRFDSAETIKESKGLYKTIKEDLASKEGSSVVTESVKAKVQKSPSKGSASSLIESKTYENPQFLRMKDLMNKIQK